jgi:oligopeptidase A
VTEAAGVAGLPPSARALASQQAVAAGHEGATAEAGPWLLTLDFPSFFPVMTHAEDRALREEMYRANITRASSGDSDNGPVIDRVLALRAEKAKLLGYENFAEVSMASKMATLPRARELLEQLRAASFAAARADLADVQAHAAVAGFAGELRHWDVSFYAERLKEAKYAISDEELRPYFPLPAVLDGLFAVAKRLFDVDIEAADGQAPVWHPDVRFFKVKKGGQDKAFFYLDPYSRPAEKRGGAWMDEVCAQSALFAAPGQAVRLPVAHMVCNQTPPVGGAPSLMTFREVETLFHEFGHAAQHMLTEQREGLVAGIRGVEWDAVELPSQFMENW